MNQKTQKPRHRPDAASRPVEGRIVARLLRWYGQHARDLPWRQVRDPYGIWVSEIMLQQTQVKTVIPYWDRWMLAFPDITALAKARPDRVLKRWEGLGYYHRARNLQAGARVIVRDFQGRFPRGYDDILALPGVGRYTAGAISSMAFNQPAPIVDGNVIRVLTRLYGIGGNPRGTAVNERLWRLAGLLVEKAANSRVPYARRCADFNQSMMELGALLCQPRQPRCSLCPVRRQCRAHATGRVMDYPSLNRLVTTEKRRSVALVAQARGAILVRRRPDGVVNAGLWEFPNMEITNKSDAGYRQWLASMNLTAKHLEPLITVNHSITRYRIRLEAHFVRMSQRGRGTEADGTWLPLSKLKSLPFTGAHKKVLEALINI